MGSRKLLELRVLKGLEGSSMTEEEETWGCLRDSGGKYVVTETGKSGYPKCLDKRIVEERIKCYG